MNVIGVATQVALAARVPILLWGPPGSGKSSFVRDVAASLNLPCETVIASIREPSDFAGLPIVVDGEVRFAPPRWGRALVEAGKGVLFLDELSTAPPAVQAALLRVVLERTVGDLVLPDAIKIVAAANPPGEAADGWDLAPPLANRFCHLNWAPDVASWTDGVTTSFKLPPALNVIEARVPVEELRALAEIGGFLKQRPDRLVEVPTDPTNAGRGWPSPRTWSMLGRLLATARVAGLSQAVVSQLAQGSVGQSAAAEFLAWSADAELPDPEAVLANPSSLVLPDRLDRAYAAVMSITAAATDGTIGKWQAGWSVLAVIAEGSSADLSVPAARQLLENRPEGATPPADAMKALSKVMSQAGLFDAMRPNP